MRIVAALHWTEKIKRLSLEKILDLPLIKTKCIKEIATSVLETEISVRTGHTVSYFLRL